jgi:hypothetical protein
VPFALHVRNDSRERTPPLVRLKAVCGPGDDGEPVLTVMRPDEDGPPGDYFTATFPWLSTSISLPLSEVM